MRAPGARDAGLRPTVALLPWGDVFEDWLDSLGVSLKEFRDEFTGSWIFGYVEALKRAGVRTVIVCVTNRTDRVVKSTHRPTGAPLYLLPAPPAFRVAHGRRLRARLDGRRDPRLFAAAVAAHVAPYLATPLKPLARLLRAERCEAILCQEYETARFDVCVVMGRVLRVPVFATFQGGDYQVSRLERPLRPLAMRAAAALIVATRSESERVRTRYRVPDGKIARIFNPVDTDAWRPVDRDHARNGLGIPVDAELVVWHGQLHARKGLDVLLDAWEHVSSERRSRDPRLLLVGGGAHASELRRRLAEERLSGTRLIDRWVNDRTAIRRFLSAGDVYAFPSLHEGFPLAPLEAMACGLPVVAADAQGIPDILEGGEVHGGVVVPRGDSQALARALGRLLDDVRWRRELGGRARRRVETAFSLDAVGFQLRRVLLGIDGVRFTGDPVGHS